MFVDVVLLVGVSRWQSEILFLTTRHFINISFCDKRGQVSDRWMMKNLRRRHETFISPRQRVLIGRGRLNIENKPLSSTVVEIDS